MILITHRLELWARRERGISDRQDLRPANGKSRVGWKPMVYAFDCSCSSTSLHTHSILRIALMSCISNISERPELWFRIHSIISPNVVNSKYEP